MAASGPKQITDTLNHFVKTWDTIEKIKQQQREQLKDLREDFKNLEKDIISFMLEKKENAMQVCGVIIILTPRAKQYTKTDKLKMMTEILHDKSKKDINIDELALMLINTTQKKNDNVSQYYLKVMPIPTSK